MVPSGVTATIPGAMPQAIQQVIPQVMPTAQSGIVPGVIPSAPGMTPMPGVTPVSGVTPVAPLDLNKPMAPSLTGTPTSGKLNQMFPLSSSVMLCPCLILLPNCPQ